jgi:hypothetical protein
MKASHLFLEYGIWNRAGLMERNRFRIFATGFYPESGTRNPELFIRDLSGKSISKMVFLCMDVERRAV